MTDSLEQFPRLPQRSLLGKLLFHGGLLGGVLLLCLWVYSSTLPTPSNSSASVVSSSAVEHSSPLMHTLLAMGSVIMLGRMLGKVLRVLGQPPVIGEIAAGLLLGPSFLGALSPAAMQLILPATVAPILGGIAQLGVMLYMFLIGLELNADHFRKRLAAPLAISHASMAVPFALGILLASPLFPSFAGSQIRFAPFALFMGVSLSITAFPVLARILTDNHLQRTPLGTLALGSAAVGDVLAWCLLAGVVGVARSQLSRSLWVIVGAAAYLLIMFCLVRPLVVHWVQMHEPPAKENDEEETEASVGQQLATGVFTQGRAAVVLIGLLFSALATECIGIHALFGSFVFGVIIPHNCTLAKSFAYKFQDFIMALLLPAFFAFVGMRTQIGLVETPQEWLICLGIILVASLGKFGGTWMGAKWVGFAGREAAVLGILMNTRGLMELIVLNVGLELGVISPKLFAMMVLMAIVTTVTTAPLLRAFGEETFSAPRTSA